jgi:hypothetical protein
LSDIDDLKKRIDQARLNQARAQAQKEQAEKLYTEGMTRLKDEFGLDNLEDARAMLGQLRSQLDTELSQVASLLDKIE